MKIENLSDSGDLSELSHKDSNNDILENLSQENSSENILTYMNIKKGISDKEAITYIKKGNYLYVYFDTEGKLLYVGITNNVITRDSAHKSTQRYDLVGELYVSRMPNSTTLKLFEKYLIANCNPPANKKDKTEDVLDFLMPARDFVNMKDVIKARVKKALQKKLQKQKTKSIVDKKINVSKIKKEEEKILKKNVNLQISREKELESNQKTLNFIRENRDNIIDIRYNKHGKLELLFDYIAEYNKLDRKIIPELRYTISVNELDEEEYGKINYSMGSNIHSSASVYREKDILVLGFDDDLEKEMDHIEKSKLSNAIENLYTAIGKDMSIFDKKSGIKAEEQRIKALDIEYNDRIMNNSPVQLKNLLNGNEDRSINMKLLIEGTKEITHFGSGGFILYHKDGTKTCVYYENAFSEEMGILEEDKLDYIQKKGRFKKPGDAKVYAFTKSDVGYFRYIQERFDIPHRYGDSDELHPYY